MRALCWHQERGIGHYRSAIDLAERDLAERGPALVPTHDRRFWLRLSVIAVIAVIVRVVYIWFWRRGLPVGGDSRYYHEGANLLAEGKGFVDPYLFLDAGKAVEAADHPPLYIVYLALFSLVGLTGATAHMLASAGVGVLTVVVIGLVGREIAGPRAGVIAALLAAVYPNLWAYDGALESETVAQLGVALTLLAAYVWWRNPTRRGAALLGGAIAVAALARAELILLVVLLLVPLVVLRSGICATERVRQLLFSWGAVALLIAPWCIYNLTRFERPVLLSTGFETTVDSASCDDTYYGAFTGYWSRRCVDPAPRRLGFAGRRPFVLAAKAYRDDAVAVHRRQPRPGAGRRRGAVGRVTGLWNLDQQVHLDFFLGGARSNSRGGRGGRTSRSRRCRSRVRCSATAAAPRSPSCVFPALGARHRPRSRSASCVIEPPPSHRSWCSPRLRSTRGSRWSCRTRGPRGSGGSRSIPSRRWASESAFRASTAFARSPRARWCSCTSR